MRKKLRLQVEKLRVEQFEVHPDAPVAGGTVHGFHTDKRSCGGTIEWDACPCLVDPSANSC